MAFQIKGPAAIEDSEEEEQQVPPTIQEVVKKTETQIQEDYLRDQEIHDLMQSFHKVQMDLVTLQAEQRVSNQR